MRKDWKKKTVQEQKLSSPQKKKLNSRILSLVLSLALLFCSALPVSAEAPDKGSGAFILTQYRHIDNTTLRKYVYNTTVQSKVVCVYDRGTLYNGYFRQRGIYSGYYFYTLSADGNSLVELKLTADGFTQTDLSTGESSFHDLGETSQSIFYYQAGKIGSVHQSFTVDGTCPLITYFNSTADMGGLSVTNPTGRDIAFAYLKTGKILSGCNAYLSSWKSRSLSYGILNQSSSSGIKGGDFSLLSPKIEDGTFSHNGTIYDTPSLARSGVVALFSYGGGVDYEYYVNFPLSAGSYGLNLKDFESFTTTGGYTYSLYRVSFYPFVQEGADGFIYRGNPTYYSADELRAAGCFEKGGNPIVNLNADPNKGDYTDGTKDPADIEDGTAGGGTGTGDGQHKGDMLEVPETTDFMTLLRNMALNIARLPSNISAAVVNALQKLPLAIANAYWDFIRDPLGTIVSLFTAVNESLGGFPASLAQLGVDLGKDVAALEVPISQAIAQLGFDFGLYLAEAETNIALSIADSIAPVVLTVAEWGENIHLKIAALAVLINDYVYTSVLDLVTGVASLGVDVFKIGQLVAEFPGHVKEMYDRFKEEMTPREDYLEGRISGLKEHFAFVGSASLLLDTIKKHFSSLNGSHSPSITVPLSDTFLGGCGVEDVVVDFDWFLPYRNDFLSLVSGFLWFGFLFQQYFSIKHILNTTSGAVSVVHH